ncbi:DUF397 domain-containing protein [Amycolatopsis sp. CA-128772]|uniref:DUF397 domain-containing protein n=1 Tax=Amycolatopsis sp. CA-128772 TaxID=2073159 RepID=UPI000CD09A86|nr:DUF397 domain-containing protein [Amycolatopsis sp. CA-128772]
MREWRTSRCSEDINCVEVALGPAAKIRDTKDRAGGTLQISTRSWDALLATVCRPATLDLSEVWSSRT